MSTWAEERAEGIIKAEGTSLALAVMFGNKNDIRNAREYLKQAIIEALTESALERFKEASE